MEKGMFCFLSDQYYIDFPDEYLMKNKETIAGISHRRPCFFAFPDLKNADIYWLVPVSSNVEKYHRYADKKLQRYGKCNTIRFGTLVGRAAAFLIQNMCPVTVKYIDLAYLDKHGNPIHIDNRTVLDVVTNAREVLAIQERGSALIFPKVLEIRQELLLQLERDHTPESNYEADYDLEP